METNGYPAVNSEKTILKKHNGNDFIIHGLFVDDMMQGLKLDQTSLEDLMQRQFRNLMQDVGVPRQSELDELRGRLDRLERQMRDLENRLWR